MRQIRLRQCAVATAVGLGILAACSGGNGNGTDDSTTQPSVAAAPTTPATSPVQTSIEVCEAALGISEPGDHAACDDALFACADGDMIACDALYLASPANSGYESYAGSCGERNALVDRFAALPLVPTGFCTVLYGPVTNEPPG